MEILAEKKELWTQEELKGRRMSKLKYNLASIGQGKAEYLKILKETQKGCDYQKKKNKSNCIKYER